MFEIQALHEKQLKTTAGRRKKTMGYATPTMGHYNPRNG